MDLYKYKFTNCSEICWQIVKTYKLSISKDTICKQFVKHPYPDSILAITDILGKFNVVVNSYSIQKIEDLHTYTKPFIVLVYVDSNYYFSIVWSLSEYTVVWFNPINHKKERISFDHFAKIFGGIATSIDTDNYVGENSSKARRCKFLVKRFVELIPFSVFAITIGLSLFDILTPNASIYETLYILGLGAGCVICAMLLDFEANDHKSSLVERLCPVGKHLNCTSVLKSHGSTLYGVSWASIGFAYFASSFIILTCMGNHSLSYIHTASFLNLISLPFIIYSLYYQIKIAKRLCIMCLSIMSILVYMFVVSVYGGFLSSYPHITTKSLVLFVTIGLIMLWASNMYIALCGRSMELNSLYPYFNRLRYDSSVFQALLNNQPLIERIPEEMSINIGNPCGKVKILKVCDPFCSACSKSHLRMEKLFENSEVFMQVIFCVNRNDSDAKKNIIKLFFALKEHYGNTFLKQVLHEWYSLKKKDYEIFKRKYDIDDASISKQGDKITWMEKKTKELKILYTPTFYIGRHHLPDDFYSEEDFSVLMKSLIKM